MPKMTKTQTKRALNAIKTKAKRLWYFTSTMSTNDVVAIEKICDKYLKKL
jgi:hypothetical protein